MKKTLCPGPRSGGVHIPASKSQAHRLLICAALGERETRLQCKGISRDIVATMDCLRALGAEIDETESGALHVMPISRIPEGLRELPCGESGSTLRFLLPLAGALGVRACFHREGRLPQRPLTPLDGELRSHGMRLREQGADLFCEGRLLPGSYRLPGDVSSQYVSGLLMALPLLAGESRLTVTGPVESAGYIGMTEDALRLARVRLEKQEDQYFIPDGQRPTLPETLLVEGDWSNVAFFLCMGALSPDGVKVKGLSASSSQGDRAVLELLARFGARVEQDDDGVAVRRGALKAQTIDAAPIPDLIPALSVVAALAEGETRIVNAGRLRLKESDRIRSTAAMLRALGGEVTELPEGLVIHGRERLDGGAVDSAGDHRIAMSAAAAACVSTGSVTVLGAECVKKSYPGFWEDFESLEGESL